MSVCNWRSASSPVRTLSVWTLSNKVFIIIIINVNRLNFERTPSARILGMTVRNVFKWNDHVEVITSKASKRLNLLKQLKGAGINHEDLVLFYCNVIRSTLEYSCQLFHQSLPNYLSDEIERIQRRALRIIYPSLKYRDALAKANITTCILGVNSYLVDSLMILLITKTTSWPNSYHPSQTATNP